MDRKLTKMTLEQRTTGMELCSTSVKEPEITGMVFGSIFIAGIY
jgi:hypothetical protein